MKICLYAYAISTVLISELKLLHCWMDCGWFKIDSNLILSPSDKKLNYIRFQSLAW